MRVKGVLAVSWIPRVVLGLRLLDARTHHSLSLTKACDTGWQVVSMGTLKAKASALSVAVSVLHDVQ